MAGYENIKDKGFDNRTTEELRVITSKGGKASGEARRRKANFRKTLNQLLTAKIDSPEWKPVLESLGIECTLESALNMAMIKEGLLGNVKAYEAIAKYAGQSQKTEIDHAEQLAKINLMQVQKDKVQKTEEDNAEAASGMKDPHDVVIPEFWDILDDTEHEHQIITSGRAGTKSSFSGILGISTIVSDEPAAVVVLRKRHNKLRKTVYKEMIRAIGRLGLSKDDFDIGVSPMEIRYKKNGNVIYFSGSDSIDDTKGIIDEDKPIRLVILDELTEFFDVGEGEDELTNIEATFVRGNDEGFRMVYLYNPPKNPNAPINVWCLKMEMREDTIHKHVDYRDVPISWIGKKLLESADLLKETDYRLYRWVWLGECIGVAPEMLGMDLYGNPVFDPDDVIFYQLPEGFLKDGGKPIESVDMEIRAEQHEKGINDSLNMLSMKCGFGQNHYRFENGSIQTATQVISENSDMFRSINKHELILEPVLKELIRIIARLGKVIGASTNPETEIVVDFDDSIIEDKQAERQSDRQDVSMGVMSLAEYRAKWYGETEEEAEKKLPEVNGVME